MSSCCLYILRLNLKVLQYKSIFKNFNVRWVQIEINVRKMCDY